MARIRHEVRDGLYGFIEFDNLEKQLIDSAPFQRLRCIHQLALCYQVYPGATHKRFEHSLGVMEIAARIFDTVFNQRISDQVQDRIADKLEPQQKAYWRRVVRVAALLHDVGHLPFSHAAEEALLPPDWNHERLTAEIIRQSEIAGILQSEKPPINPEDVVDVAWDVRKRSKVEVCVLPPWQTLLNEIITGNIFGADRIDYLLRDSWHTGVTYGRFDPDRLIGGLRVVIDSTKQDEIALGLDIGGIHAAEALLLARYFMYTQVYLHDVRRVYDLHLKDFLQAWLPGKTFSEDWQELMKVTDHEVLVAMRQAVSNSEGDLNTLARRVLNRQHFRTVYNLVGSHLQKLPTVFEDVLQFAQMMFGAEKTLFDTYNPTSEKNDFPALTEDGSIVSSLEESSVITNVPSIQLGLIFVAPEIKEEARKKIDAYLHHLLKRGGHENADKEANGGI